VRRWLRVLVVGVLTVVLSIDSASACRLFRSRCRPRCRVVSCRVVRPVCGSVATCQPYESAIVVESLPVQCCVPVDGSAHAVIIETDQAGITVPSHAESAPAPSISAPVAAEATRPATPTAVLEPLEPLTPIAPASAEQPLSPKPPAGAELAPAPQPQFKTAAEILAESAEKAAAEAATPPAPAAEPPMRKEASTVPAPQPAPVDEPPTPLEPSPVQPAPAPAPVPEEPETPAEPATKKPAPKPAAENFFDEDGDEAEDKPASEDSPPVKKKAPPQEAIEDLFDEPEAETPSSDAVPEPAEKPEDDPFAGLDANPEPVRRWIDSTGRHETIGRLVEVHSDRVRILKHNGRYTTVPMRLLSQHDQSYAATVGDRLAGRAPARPAATDTAHR